MISGQSLSIADALEITTQMLSFAKSDEWEKVIKLEAERQEIVKKTLNGIPLKKDSHSGKIITKILDIDSQIQLLAATEKNQLQDQLIQIHRNNSKL